MPTPLQSKNVPIPSTDEGVKKWEYFGHTGRDENWYNYMGP